MTPEDLEILDRAADILSGEGYRGYYDTDQARVFWKAGEMIHDSVRIIKEVNRN